MRESNRAGSFGEENLEPSMQMESMVGDDILLPEDSQILKSYEILKQY